MTASRCKLQSDPSVHCDRHHIDLDLKERSTTSLRPLSAAWCNAVHIDFVIWDLMTDECYKNHFTIAIWPYSAAIVNGAYLLLYSPLSRRLLLTSDLRSRSVRAQLQRIEQCNGFAWMLKRWHRFQWLDDNIKMIMWCDI